MNKEVVIPKGMEAYYDQFYFAPAVKDRYIKLPYPAWTAIGVSALASWERWLRSKSSPGSTRKVSAEENDFEGGLGRRSSCPRKPVLSFSPGLG